MKGFTFKKGRIGDSLFAHSFFKSFIVFVVMMLMITSSASAEIIDGLNYELYSDVIIALKQYRLYHSNDTASLAWLQVSLFTWLAIPV